MLDLDGDVVVTPSEILEVFKQMRLVGARVQSREDPSAIAVLNKLSDAMNRDQRRAARAFREADREERGYLMPTDLPK
jgi:hypothetical protein